MLSRPGMPRARCSSLSLPPSHHSPLSDRTAISPLSYLHLGQHLLFLTGWELLSSESEIWVVKSRQADKHLSAASSPFSYPVSRIWGKKSHKLSYFILPSGSSGNGAERSWAEGQRDSFLCLFVFLHEMGRCQVSKMSMATQ